MANLDILSVSLNQRHIPVGTKAEGQQVSGKGKKGNSLALDKAEGTYCCQTIQTLLCISVPKSRVFDKRPWEPEGRRAGLFTATILFKGKGPWFCPQKACLQQPVAQFARSVWGT